MLLLLSSGVWRVWKWSHRGGWRYGALGREELSRSSAKKEHWAKSGRPCSGKTSWTPRDPRLEGDVARFTHTGATARPRHLQHSGFLMKWQTKGFLVKQRLEESGPKAPLFTKQTKPDNLVFTGWTPPVCSGNETPSLSRGKRVTGWGRSAGKPAWPPRATHCSP